MSVRVVVVQKGMRQNIAKLHKKMAGGGLLVKLGGGGDRRR
jgi:hypothetical protein